MNLKLVKMKTKLLRAGIKWQEKKRQRETCGRNNMAGKYGQEISQAGVFQEVYFFGSEVEPTRCTFSYIAIWMRKPCDK